MTHLPLPPGWPAAAAALLGVVAALWLRRRRYRVDDDVRSRAPSPWTVPVLAVVGTALAAPCWRGQPPMVVGGYLVALVWALTLAVIDAEVQRLPDRLVLPAYPAAAVLLTLCSLVGGDLSASLRAAACAGFAVVVFLAAALLSPGADGLGLGDVKLSGVLGALLGWFGWYPAFLGLAAGFVVGGLVALTLLLLGRVDRRSHLPLGPALVLGAYLGAVAAPVL